MVEEGVLGTRLRRPLDLVRMIGGIATSLVISGFVYVAAQTSADLDESLLTASRRLPDFLVLLLNVIGGIGLLLLPLAVSTDLLLRRRGRQLFDALVGLFVATSTLTALSLLVESRASDKLRLALAGSLQPTDDPFLPLFGGLIAFLTVARTMARPRWNTLTMVVTASLLAVSFISGGLTVVGLALSLLIGWVCGLAVRYAFGTPTTRPSGEAVARTLIASGYAISRLEAEQATDIGRRYRATMTNGAADEPLHVTVLDRDLEGAGLAAALWQVLRLRNAVREPHVNMRRTLEQQALLAYAAQAADIPAPRLLLASEVGPDAALLLERVPEGIPLAELPCERLTDEVLQQIFELVRAMQRAHLAHRSLNLEHLVLLPSGRIELTGIGGGTVAASDLATRIDLAELLCSLALRVGAERTVAAATSVLGVETVTRALPVLQRVALSQTTRRGLRERRGLLDELRDRVLEQNPDVVVEQIQLERVRPRTLVTLVLGTAAGYALLSQLARVDLVGLVRQADWRWALLALVCSLGTYAAATWALLGFIPEGLRFRPTFAAQFAASFATLVSPPTLGTVAVNLRFLQRQGVHPALATASIGASQGMAFVTHLLLLVLLAVLAGTQSDLTFQPPRGVVIGVAAAAAATLGFLALPWTRQQIARRLGPQLRQIGPRLLTVVQRPRKLAEGLGGLVLLNVFYVVALAGCVYAFDGKLSVAAIGVVYLTGSVVGQAAPTPGGLGAVEAAMAAGLTAAGLAGGVAVSAVLLFRLVTFWLPTIPGWFALNGLQKRGML